MQNINLLTTLPAKPKRYLMADYLLYVIAGWFLLLLFFYAIHFYLVSREQTNLAQLISIKSTMVKNIIVLNKEQHEPQQAIHNISPALAAFLAKQTTNKFSTYLQDLAYTTPNGIWLNKIMFSNIDNDISVSGNTISAGLIPQFLHNLNTSKAFAGKQFSNLHLEKKKAKNGKKSMEFVLTTKMGRTL